MAVPIPISETLKVKISPINIEMIEDVFTRWIVALSFLIFIQLLLEVVRSYVSVRFFKTVYQPVFD